MNDVPRLEIMPYYAVTFRPSWTSFYSAFISACRFLGSWVFAIPTSQLSHPISSAEATQTPSSSPIYKGSLPVTHRHARQIWWQWEAASWRLALDPNGLPTLWLLIAWTFQVLVTSLCVCHMAGSLEKSSLVSGCVYTRSKQPTQTTKKKSSKFPENQVETCCLWAHRQSPFDWLHLGLWDNCFGAVAPLFPNLFLLRHTSNVAES